MRLQRRSVEQASAVYHSLRESLNNAHEKLAGLEEYFEHGPALKPSGIFGISLIESDVFSRRLREAIRAQHSACQLLETQCESARLVLVQAEQRRAGLAKAGSLAAQQLQAKEERLMQRELEDNLTGRYGLPL